MSATQKSIDLATTAATAAADKLGTDIVIIDVSDQLVITDCFVIVSASNERQVKSIVDGIEDRLLKDKVKPVRREGAREGRWVLLDYIDIVVHVQHAEERVFYDLARLWKDCPEIPFEDPARTAADSPE